MMDNEEINWKKHFLQSLAIFFFGGVLHVSLWCDNCFESVRTLVVNFSFSGFFWFFLSKGSEYIVFRLDRIYSWLEHPIKRLFSGIIVIIVYATITVRFLEITYGVLFFDKTFMEALMSSSRTGLFITIVVTLVINTFMHGRGFLLEWREASVNMEKLKTEQVSVQYESLKNQVNPHFLFNSLNALSSLVYDDQAKAVEFIRRLSQVYRYVLDKKDLELVPIDDEMKLMKDYIFLHQIRFGDNLKIDMEEEKTINGYLPPLAIQLLIENAIKHNVISEKHPLKIEINVDQEYFTIRNNIKEKLGSSGESTGIGLTNLVARYEYLSDKKVEILNNGESFTVRLPVLQLNR